MKLKYCIQSIRYIYDIIDKAIINKDTEKYFLMNIKRSFKPLFYDQLKDIEFDNLDSNDTRLLLIQREFAKDLVFFNKLKLSEKSCYYNNLNSAIKLKRIVEFYFGKKQTGGNPTEYTKEQFKDYSNLIKHKKKDNTDGNANVYFIEKDGKKLVIKVIEYNKYISKSENIENNRKLIELYIKFKQLGIGIELIGYYNDTQNEKIYLLTPKYTSDLDSMLSDNILSAKILDETEGQLKDKFREMVFNSDEILFDQKFPNIFVKYNDTQLEDLVFGDLDPEYLEDNSKFTDKSEILFDLFLVSLLFQLFYVNTMRFYNFFKFQWYKTVSNFNILLFFNLIETFKQNIDKFNDLLRNNPLSDDSLMFHYIKNDAYDKNFRELKLDKELLDEKLLEETVRNIFDHFGLSDDIKIEITSLFKQQKYDELFKKHKIIKNYYETKDNSRKKQIIKELLLYIEQANST